MESDEYYDSLEQELNSDSLEGELDVMIPFYDGHLNLSKINITGQTSKCCGSLVDESKKYRQKIFPNKNKLKTPVYSRKTRNSYLKLYYEQAGSKCLKNEKSVLRKNSQINCHTPSNKSFTTYNDTELNYNKIDLKNSESEISINCEKNNSVVVPELHLDTSSPSKYRSISDLNFSSNKYPRLVFNSKSRCIFKTNNNGLVPIETELFNNKHESWRRRQQYGKKVSELNRIKMNERRILRNLEKQLQNSKI